MKSKVYESFFGVHIFSFLFFLLLFVLLFSLIPIKSIPTYKMVSGVVSKDNQVMLLVNNEELDMLYHIKTLLVDGYKEKFRINRVTKNIIKRKKKNYHQIYLDISFDNYMENDSILIGIFQEKVSFLTLFSDIWKGG